MKAFLFPGQGSQTKGMGGALFDEFKDLTQKADKILGYSIKALCLEDPNKQLNQTQFAQPALYVVSALSYFKKIKESGQKPDYVAGHSLGEFNALLAAECYDFEAGLKLVKKRGELMGKATGGGMAAILNATQEEIEKSLKENGLDNIALANFNTPSQIVISGPKEEIESAQSVFQDGDVLYIALKTSGAFHSKYMQPAKKEFGTYLKKFKFSALKIPVITNVAAKPYSDDDVIANLSNQITSPVKWSDSIQYLMGLGDMAFEEIGHGNVLTKMVREIKAESPKASELKSDEMSETHVDPEESAKTVDEKSDAPKQSKGASDETLKEEEKQESIKIKPQEGARPLTAEEKVSAWNSNHPIGTHVKSILIDDDDLKTRTEAVVLFGHRSAVYIEGYNGYFDLDEITPL